MARRAAEPETGQNEVVDLNNDARWQARLEEARARRAEALKLKGLDDKPRRAPSKPWEDEADTALAAERHQRSLDDDGLDFHDRMNALQKVLREKRPEPDAVPDVPEHMRNWSPEAVDEVVEADLVAPEPAPMKAPLLKAERAGPPVDSLFEDPAFAAPDPVDAPEDEPEFVPLEALVDPLPPVRSRPTRRPWIEEAEAEESKAAEAAPVDQVEPTTRKSEGMPFFLGMGLVALVALPFFNLLPPMTRGPDAAEGPVFGVQPAFGITAAMVEFPVATQSGEFVPTSIVAPVGPLPVADPRPPAFSRVIPSVAAAPGVEVFVMPEVSPPVDTHLTPFARAVLPSLEVTQAMWETQSFVAKSAGRLPGVLAPVTAANLVPVPRP